MFFYGFRISRVLRTKQKNTVKLLPEPAEQSFPQKCRSNLVLGLVGLGFGEVWGTFWYLLACFGALLGCSWLLLGGPGPALGTFLGPRGHLLAGLGRILGGFWVPGTLWALILKGPGTCRAGFWYVSGSRFSASHFQ